MFHNGTLLDIRSTCMIECTSMVRLIKSRCSHVVGMDLATRAYIYTISSIRRLRTSNVTRYLVRILRRLIDELLLLTYVRNSNSSDISRIVITHISSIDTILDISKVYQLHYYHRNVYRV